MQAVVKEGHHRKLARAGPAHMTRLRLAMER